MDTYSLLAHCARTECSAAHYRQLAQEATGFTEWETVPAQAEAHGLSPLLYVHLRSAGVQVPRSVERKLRALYLRHRHANGVRMRVLSEMLTAFEAAGIQAVVLKGGALCHLIYPQPGLRPMRDLDLLVRGKPAARRAQGVVALLDGYVPQPRDKDAHGAHLTSTLRRDNLRISVEIHYDLPGLGMDKPIAFSPQPGGPTAYTLGYEETLWYLCQHMTAHANVFESTRLVWVADVVGFAEHFVAEIDWERIKEQFPAALDRLSLLHFVTPLSEALLRQAPLEIGRAPRGIGDDFQGWPRLSLAAQRRKGYWRILRDTLFPSEWWLRLHYGLGSAGSLFWYRWLRHPLDILGWARQLLLERMRGRASSA